MFTGLVETLGTLRRVGDDGAGGRALAVAAPDSAAGLELGDSVAVNGACLTVVALDGDIFEFQAGPETLAKTNLGTLRPGDRVNLERSCASATDSAATSSRGTSMPSAPSPNAAGKAIGNFSASPARPT